MLRSASIQSQQGFWPETVCESTGAAATRTVCLFWQLPLCTYPEPSNESRRNCSADSFGADSCCHLPTSSRASLAPFFSQNMGSEGFRQHLAVGQNQLGAPPILVYFNGDWDAHGGYGVSTHGHLKTTYVRWARARVGPCQAIPCARFAGTIRITGRGGRRAGFAFRGDGWRVVFCI